MALNNDAIKEKVLKLQKAGAPPSDIEAFVKSATGVQDFGFPTPDSGKVNDYLQSQNNAFKSTGNLIQDVFPNRNLGDVIGTGLAKMNATPEQKPFVVPSTATTGGVIGDVAGDVLNVASLLAPEAGTASLLKRSLLSAGSGAGLSLANSLSQGKSLFDSETLSNATGAGLITGSFPLVGNFAEGLNNAGKSAIIDNQMKNILTNPKYNITPEELGSYISAAKNNAQNIEHLTPLGLADAHVGEAADVLQKKIGEAGKQVELAHAESGSLPIGLNKETGNNHIDDIFSNFTKRIEDQFGHSIEVPRGDMTSIEIAGKKVNANSFAKAEETPPELVKMPGRHIQIDSGDQKRILNVYSQIKGLAENPTVQGASDIVHNLDSTIDWDKLQKYGTTKDPVDAIMANLRGQINHQAIRESAPAVAQANDTFSGLQRLKDEFVGLVGNDLQRGELPLKRLFSGEKNNDVVSTFNKIKEKTGIDLIKHGALAQFATDTFGAKSAQSLLQQRISGGIQEAAGIVEQLKRSAIARPLKALERKLISPDAEKYAMSLVKTNPEASSLVDDILKKVGISPTKKGVNILDKLSNSRSAKNLLDTYAKNVVVAHPDLGGNLVQSGRNLITNLTQQ